MATGDFPLQRCEVILQSMKRNDARGLVRDELERLSRSEWARPSWLSASASRENPRSSGLGRRSSRFAVIVKSVTFIGTYLEATFSPSTRGIVRMRRLHAGAGHGRSKSHGLARAIGDRFMMRLNMSEPARITTGRRTYRAAGAPNRKQCAKLDARNDN